MLGAIIGDIVGSPYEFHNIKTKDFPLFCERSCFTDDTILTCATADWLINGGNPAKYLQKWGKMYADRTYENGKVAPFGEGFTKWLETGQEYNAKTNGCIMRLSPVPLWFDNMNDAMQKALELTKITHNHPESLNAAKAYIETAYLLKNNTNTAIIKNVIAHKYGYDMQQSVDEIRPDYNKFYCSCKNSVPQAIICALEAKSYEDAIRNAISLGGDSDTLACMAGGLAQIKFPVPAEIIKNAEKYMDDNVKNILHNFSQKVSSEQNVQKNFPHTTDEFIR